MLHNVMYAYIFKKNKSVIRCQTFILLHQQQQKQKQKQPSTVNIRNNFYLHAKAKAKGKTKVKSISKEINSHFPLILLTCLVCIVSRL